MNKFLNTTRIGDIALVRSDRHSFEEGNISLISNRGINIITSWGSKFVKWVNVFDIKRGKVVGDIEQPNFHFILEVWCDSGKICVEVDLLDLFQPSLVLSIDEGRRPIEDWYRESMLENLQTNTLSFIPKNVEIYEEPILLEAIGTYSAHGYVDCYGEYDEDFYISIAEWTVDVIATDRKQLCQEK